MSEKARKSSESLLLKLSAWSALITQRREQALFPLYWEFQAVKLNQGE